MKIQCFKEYLGLLMRSGKYFNVLQTNKFEINKNSVAITKLLFSTVILNQTATNTAKGKYIKLY